MSISRVASRRDILRLASLGGVVFASNLFRSTMGCSSSSTTPAGANGLRTGAARGAAQDFFFLQLSDPHWGFSGPKVNPEPELELPSAIAIINAAPAKPDFVIFTGDLTHTTDDVTVRRQRMTDVKRIVSTLDVPMVKYMPGEHDAAADGGAAFKEFFGDTRYSFDHRGIHFVALDNVSDPMSSLGDAQLAWLQSDLAPLDAESPIVVFSHRPLWALRADWGLDDAGRAEGHRFPDAVSECDGLLRSHPPGAPPHDGTHPAPLRAIAHVRPPFARQRRVEAEPRALGPGPPQLGARVPVRRGWNRSG